MEPALSISGLVVRRSGQAVLHGMDLELAAGTVTGVLGPSGSGKTTLLRTVAGLQRWHAGSVRVLGRTAGHPRLRSEVGYMSQSPAVYGDLTTAGNLRYHAALHRRGRRAADEVLEAIGLAGLADRTVATLSGGERGRVSLGCALVGRPRLLLLDEPTVGLDPVLRRELWGLFQELARDDGVSLLVSSHVMDEAQRCEQLVLLRQGRVVATGTPQQLRAGTGAADMEQVFLRLVHDVPEEMVR